MEEWAELTKVKVRKGFLSVVSISDTQIVELYPPVARSLLDNDYAILSGDNEGFEAEIFFGRGPKVTGTFYMRERACEGQVELTLVLGAPRYRKGQK